MTNEEIGTLWAERNALEAIVTNLRAERDAQHTTYTALHDALIVAEGQRDQLRAERDALRKDAELYRAFFDGLDSVYGAYGDTVELCYVSADAASLAVGKIAAAMEGQP